MSRLSFALFLTLAVQLGCHPPTKAQTPPTHPFENAVRRYEVADQAQPPPPHAILLAGDSQFYRWKSVDQDLPGYTVINRGIDGLQTADLLYFADRLVLPYRARLIVLHIGGNDVHGGKSPEQVLADFKALVARIRAVQPTVPIIFSSLTPGPGRREEFGRRQATNRTLQNYIASQPGLSFLDLWTPMLTPDGQPRADLWVADGVHPNHAGYLLRVKLSELRSLSSSGVNIGTVLHRVNTSEHDL